MTPYQATTVAAQDDRVPKIERPGNSASLEDIAEPVTIDPRKVYRARDGRKVRIYAADGGGLWCVQGAVFDEVHKVWIQESWRSSGDYVRPGHVSSLDLIEAPFAPRPPVSMDLEAGIIMGLNYAANAAEADAKQFGGRAASDFPKRMRQAAHWPEAIVGSLKRLAASGGA